jgi:hypothetical protein
MADPGVKSPISPVVLLIMAVLGVSTLQGTIALRSNSSGSAADGDGSDDSAVGSAQGASKVDDSGFQQFGNTSLIDQFVRSGGSGSAASAITPLPLCAPGSAAQPPPSPDDRQPTIRCLIVTTPDPYGSTNSHRFDEHLDAVQRAIEAHDYVLDGYRMRRDPKTSPAAPRPETVATRIRLGIAGVDSQIAAIGFETKVGPPPPDTSQPDLVLFRSTVNVNDLILVLLAPESPTVGLDKGIMTRCLEIAQEWDSRNRCAGGQHKLNILGPRFSGSMQSLEQAIGNWLKGQRPHDIVVISGTATGDFDESSFAEHIKTRSGAAEHTITLRTTQHKTSTIMKALLNYVGQREPIAVLTESDTTFGKYDNPPPDAERTNLVCYAFPSNISQLRASYDKDGAKNDGQRPVIPAAERLTLPLGDGNSPRDIIAPRTPGFTSAAAELILDEMMTDLAARRFKKVGIVATDPRDVFFLAKKVKKACTDVQLFTPINNRLYSHAQLVSDMRGMLVGSTYPLFPRNQELTFPYLDGAPHSFFASDDAEGAYNAAVAQVWSLRGQSLGQDFRPPQFLDYGVPYDPPFDLDHAPAGGNSKTQVPRQPAVWICRVGYHGTVPVKALRLDGNAKTLDETPVNPDECKKQAELLYSYQQGIEDFRSRELKGKGANAKTDQARYEHVQRRLGPRINRHTVFSFWGLVFSISTVTCWLTAIVTANAARWVHGKDPVDDPQTFKIAGIPCPSLALFLNCCFQKNSVNRPADGVVRGDIGPFIGPGSNLGWLLTLAFVCYGSFVWPLVSGVFGVRGLPVKHGAWAVGFASVALATEIAMIVVLKDYLIELTAKFARLLFWGVMMVALLIAAALSPFDPGAISVVFWVVVGASGVIYIQLRPGGSKRLRHAVGLSVITVGLVVALWGRHDTRLVWERDSLLKLERSMNVTSGAVPVFALVFLGIAGGALIIMRLTDRYFFQQFMPHPSASASNPSYERREGAVGIEQLVAELRRAGQDLQENVRSLPGFLAWFARTHAHRFALALGFTAYFAGPLLVRLAAPLFGAASRQFDDRLFDAISLVLFSLIFLFVTLNCARLALMWMSIHWITKKFLQLPVKNALVRLPSEAARWFFESPSLDGFRLSLLIRQANTLSDQLRGVRHDPVLNDRLEKLLEADAKRMGGATDPFRWKGIDSVAAGLQNIDASTASRSRMDVWPVVRAHWESESMAQAYPHDAAGPDGKGRDGNTPERAPSRVVVATSGDAVALAQFNGSSSAGVSLRSRSWTDLTGSTTETNRVVTVQNGSGIVEAPSNGLRPLLDAAEDFFILAFVSWLAVEMAHVWKRITLLVVAALALLLAVASYPFPFQNHLMFGLWLLIGFLAVVIVRIVWWINREELVAKLANQSPGQWLIPGSDFSMILTHVVPLVGALLAATSSQVSDMLRTFLDPILRYLH